MKNKSKLLLMMAVIVLAACSNSDRFGGGGRFGGDDASGAGTANDPTSVAYFQQSIGERILFVVDQHTLNPEA